MPTDALLSLRVTDIQPETADTRSFFLEDVNGQPVTYRAGQFLTLVLTLRGHEIRRSYSLSSAPGEPLRITVKRVANGEVSRWLLDTLQVGDALTALPPTGRFTLDDTLAGNVVLLGAGSGISPLFSMLKDVLLHQPERSVTLLYSNTRESSIIFRDELADWQARYPDRFRLIHLLSQPSDDWTGLRGRLNNILLERLLSDVVGKSAVAHDQFFLCGPLDYMRMAQFTLTVNGVPPDHIRREQFVIDEVPTATTFPDGATVPHTVQLQFQGSATLLPVPARTTLLQAALNAGIRLPYSCRGGRCSACVARCTAGQVFMSINDVLTERDLAQGYVLTCTGYPLENDVRLEV